MNKQHIRNYIYLDCKNIDMFYNQFAGNNRMEKTTSTHTVNGEICADIGSGEVIKKVFNSSIGATVEGGIILQEESSHMLTYENKVNEIIENIYNNQVETLSDYIANNPPQSETTIACRAVFSLDYVFDNDRKSLVTRTDIVNNPFLYSNVSYRFVSTPQTIYGTEDEFIVPNSAVDHDYEVDMYIDGKFMYRSVRHITNKLKLKSNFTFYIWGALSYGGSNNRKRLYNIKPFAIWRLTNRNM